MALPFLLAAAAPLAMRAAPALSKLLNRQGAATATTAGAIGASGATEGMRSFYPSFGGGGQAPTGGGGGGQQPTPQAPFNPNSPGGAGGGGRAGGAAAPANYDWMVDAQLGELGNQQGVGLGNLTRSYQANKSNLTNARTRTFEDLDQAKTSTQQDNLLTRENIGRSVRNNLTGLQRLLGARGAGASSASKVLAPYAAGLQGNQQTQDVSRTYGMNMGALDTSRKRQEEDYGNKFNQLEDNRVNSERDFLSTIAATRQRLLAQKGDPNARGQIEALGREITNYGNRQVTNPGEVAYSRPDLAKYNYDAAEAGQLNERGGARSNLGPFWQLLQNDKDKQVA